MRTLARDRCLRLVQGESSGRNSRGLPYSCRDSSRDRARRSMTGVVRRLVSRQISRRSVHRFSSTADDSSWSGPQVHLLHIYPQRYVCFRYIIEGAEQRCYCKYQLVPCSTCTRCPSGSGALLSCTIYHGDYLQHLTRTCSVHGVEVLQRTPKATTHYHVVPVVYGT